MLRQNLFFEVFPEAPRYRQRQFFEALFEPQHQSFEDVTTLSRTLRLELSQRTPWMTLTRRHVIASLAKDTFKALLETQDHQMIETVLMKNSRGFWSVCVSSQIGCAMACTFCATGKMGFTRSLTADEIIDQYRFWMYYLAKDASLEQRISNIVYMGMGEPLANYDSVKLSLQMLLQYTDMGPTRLTVSTVGLIPILEKLLSDSEWPPVRLAVSLHSADSETRKNIMPSSYEKFLEDLEAWTKKYFQKFDTRRRHLTFEYVMLSGVNDTEVHAKKLIQFVRAVGKVRVNLIPYNDTQSKYATSESRSLLDFEARLQKAGVDVTRRKTKGADIAAACGQLIVEKGRKLSSEGVY